MSPAEQIPERDALLKAVDEIGPIVQRQAERSESMRHLSPEGLEAIESAGVLRMMWPRQLGGYEADPITQHEVIDRLAYHDASAGWCGFIGAGSSAFVAANLSAEGLDEVRSSLAGTGRSGWVRLAGSPQPVGKAVAVSGGHRISGRWPWLSGVHHSDWVFLGAIVHEEGEPKLTKLGIPEYRAFVVSTSAVEIEDTWYTAGLSGTGSTHAHASELFVPQHRTFDFPFNAPQRGGPLFRLPVLGFFGPAFSGFPQGVGRRALDEVKRLARSKRRVMAPSVLAERGVFQHDLARAHDRLRAARLLVKSELAALWQRLHDDSAATEVESAELLSAFSHNGDTALETAEMAYRYAGGDAVYRSHPLQRFMRDMRVASQHILIGEHNYDALGRALLAAEPEA